MPLKIMIVEDEIIAAHNISKYLKLLEYEVFDITSNYDDALKAVQKTRPDLVLMDINVNGKKDGIEIAKDLWQMYQIPSIFLTAYSDKEIIERTKTASPIGYITKPFTSEALSSTIEISWANYQKYIQYSTQNTELSDALKNTLKDEVNHSIVDFGCNTYLNMELNVIVSNEKEIALTKKEYEFLSSIAIHPNKIFSSNELESILWQDDSVAESSLKSLVWRLRKKLPFDVIANIVGVGYRFKKCDLDVTST